MNERGIGEERVYTRGAARECSVAVRTREVDALSEVLAALRLSGAAFFLVNAAPRWTAATPPGHTLGPAMLHEARQVISCHRVMAGSGSHRCVFAFGEAGDGRDGGPEEGERDDESRDVLHRTRVLSSMATVVPTLSALVSVTREPCSRIDVAIADFFAAARFYSGNAAGGAGGLRSCDWQHAAARRAHMRARSRTSVRLSARITSATPLARLDARCGDRRPRGHRRV